MAKLTLIAALLLVVGCLLVKGDKDLLRKYARQHAGTKIVKAYAQRYDPWAWPAWYVRTLLRTNGHSRLVNPNSRLPQSNGNGNGAPVVGAN